MVALQRRPEAVSLAWPAVELLCDGVAKPLTESCHAGSPGQVLADEPISVLVAASLPRVVGSSEVKDSLRALFDPFVVVELRFRCQK